MWGPQGEQAWPGGPHPAQLAALDEAARREREVWDAMSAEDQQAHLAARAAAEVDVARRREDAAKAAKAHVAHVESEIARLLAALAEAGNPGLRDRTMTAVRGGLFGGEVPVTIGQAWPCGTLDWRQHESSSVPPTGRYPTGVSTSGTLVPMTRVLVGEPKPVVRRRGFAVLGAGIQVTTPFEAGPPGFGATSPRLRELVRATLSAALGKRP